MAASQKFIKDKEMAAMLKRNGVERQTGRCAICYGVMPNGTFYPEKALNHIVTCPGPSKRSGSNGPVKGVR